MAKQEFAFQIVDATECCLSRLVIYPPGGSLQARVELCCQEPPRHSGRHTFTQSNPQQTFYVEWDRKDA